MTSLLLQVLVPHRASWPTAARLALSALVVVLLLGCVVMPVLTRILAGRLHPRR